MNLPERTEAPAAPGGLMRLVALAKRLVEAPGFEYFIIAVILGNAVVLGLGTSPTLERMYGDWFEMGNNIALGIFIVEALLKMFAVAPRAHRYFRDGWNIFDFLVIVASLVPVTGEYAMITRLARLLRVVRLISTVRDLRLIVAALVRSIPSVIHVMLLMSIVVYIYAIMGYHLFHEHDPENWRSLGISVLTLFNIITLEGWTVVMYEAMEAHPWAWLYFVSFIIAGTFVVINLFVAIIINNLEEAKADRLRELAVPPSRDELLREIRATQAALQRLERRLDGDDEEQTAGRG